MAQIANRDAGFGCDKDTLDPFDRASQFERLGHRALL